MLRQRHFNCDNLLKLFKAQFGLKNVINGVTCNYVDNSVKSLKSKKEVVFYSLSMLSTGNIALPTVYLS